ncbi:DUF6281 family protein [Streptomyces sp. NBC_00859]|uniref:DUF6281 family protein n=1 Tax=Streptomyces sp. NBC_00859 TaxID=2903682 RepID=UPI00386D00CC
MVLVLASAAGCGSGGPGAASCAAAIKFDERTYLGMGVGIKFHIGRRLGTAPTVTCNDTGRKSGRSEESYLAVYEINELDRADAVGVGEKENPALYVAQDGGHLPPEVSRLLKGSRN